MRRLLLATFRHTPVRVEPATAVAPGAPRALVAALWLCAFALAVAQLPAEARDVLVRVRAGGPFPYERDGATFGNRERLLPVRKRGFYHEYTVETPGARNRGARRIICGGPRRTPEVCYYTDDHYASFRRIRE